VLEDSTKRLAEKQELSSALNQEFSVVVVELFKSGAITKGTKGVTPPSSGRLIAGCAVGKPPLMSNVRT